MPNNVVVSIIIVNYNTDKLLIDCVKSVSSSMRLSDFELIVVDNSSSDESLIEFKKEYPDVFLINNKENVGFSKAVNQTLKTIKGQFVLLLNPDTVIEHGSIDKMISFMQDNPQTGVCGPAIYNPDKTLQMSSHHFPRLLDIFFDKTHLSKIFSKNPLFGRYQMSYWAHDTTREVDWLTGACLMVRTELLNQINGFDERFFMFCEDIDLCLRIKQKGFKSVFLPQAKIIHYKSGSSNIIRNKAPIMAWESLIMFWQKHYGQFSAFLLKGILCLDAIVKIAALKIMLLKVKNNEDTLAEIDYFKQILKNILK